MISGFILFNFVNFCMVLKNNVFKIFEKMIRVYFRFLVVFCVGIDFYIFKLK